MPGSTPGGLLTHCEDKPKMTKDEIMQLTGPALSNAVAEHVMRWRRMPVCGDDEMGAIWADASNQWRLVPIKPIRPGDVNLINIACLLWEPHTKAGDAMPCLKTFNSWQITQDAFLAGFVQVWRGGRLGKTDFVCSDEMPTAICRAALLALVAT